MYSNIISQLEGGTILGIAMQYFYDSLSMTESAERFSKWNKNFCQEYIAVSDPEMEPHYECDLCGNQVSLFCFPHFYDFHNVLF